MFAKLFERFASPRRLQEAGILGMNKRNYSVIAQYNRRRLYPLVDDKVQTKMLANKIGINTPGLIGVIEYQHEVKNILEIVKGYKEFVVKPAHGSGGKGVLVGATMLVFLDPRIFLVALVLFVLSVALTRWVSLGSILGAVSFPITMQIFHGDIRLTIIAALMSAAVIFMHRTNIKRILSGKENRFSFHSKPQITDDKK